MKKYFLLTIFLFVFLTVASFADTVYLKNGRVVQGEIVSETKYSVKMKVGGRPKIFYADEVDRVEYAQDAPQSVQPVEAFDPKDISEEKKTLILRLLEVNGATEGIRSTLRTVVGNLPPEQAAEFEGLLKSDELIMRFVPIYAKYFTEEELREMIRFYGNPAGKRVLEVAPKLMEESIKEAIAYFQEKEKKPEASQQ
jgi:sRNA-binding regulator protein Hfq